jgi:tol-pal system beta propeller repeat protein TolB
MKLGILCFLFSMFAYGELSFDDPQNKTIKEVPVIINGSEKSISEVTIRVQGATIRNFRLYKQFSLQNLTSIQKKQAESIKNIIERDLAIVGGLDFITEVKTSFSDEFLKQQGAEGKTEVSFKFIKDKISIIIKNTNFITNKFFEHIFDSDNAGLRKLAHYASKSIFEAFVGPEDLFLRQLMAIKTDADNNQQIVLMDFDGENEKVITNDKWTKVSPSFSPDGKSILYSIITDHGHAIIEHDLITNKRVFRTKKIGVNMEPRINPNNKCMLASLSLEKSTNLYKADRNGNNLIKITDSLGVNLSANISASGKKLAFVSDRSGNPQIYIQDFTTNCDLINEAKRVTFLGNYNQNPYFSPDEKNLVFVGRDEKNVFDIFLLELSSLKISRVTQNQGNNRSPLFSHSGRLVIFASQRFGNKKNHLYVSNLSGNYQVKITSGNSSYDSIAISPMIIK